MLAIARSFDWKEVNELTWKEIKLEIKGEEGSIYGYG
jgi:hypothetical protein